MDAKSLLIAGALWLGGCAAGADGLDKLHADIVSDYPNVSHIEAKSLAAMEDVLVLDIREEDEFAVSRLPGAIRVSPSARKSDVLVAIGDARGRDIVVYCSVGRRSSIFARDHQDILLASGARSVANLEGGIFRWHGEERALVDANGPTDAVHPYDAYWKRYVVRQDGARYEPNTAAQPN